MNFQEKLNNYANLIVEYCLNIQPGQNLNISCEIIHRHLAQLLTIAAYKRGAKFVNVDFIDPTQIRNRIVKSKSDEYLKYVPRYIPQKYEDFVEDSAAVVRIVGSEEPDILADLPPQKISILQNSLFRSLKNYYDEGVGKSKVQWNVAAASTPKWGKKVFPELSPEAAEAALWEEIFKICRADKPNAIEIWKKHNATLWERAKRLTELKIHQLHFSGRDTDLKVLLSPKALWVGGAHKGPRDVLFEPNIPTEECFTTPDCRYTSGKVRVTRPIFINGKLVKDLYLKFENGSIVDFSASEGHESFQAYITRDPNANKLGEVALVGIDSPVFQSKRVFQEILYDENAACHIAVGFAYRFCLEGGPNMTEEQLAETGCNISSVHTDMMISDEQVDVSAITFDGKHVPLLIKGLWQSF